MTKPPWLVSCKGLAAGAALVVFIGAIASCGNSGLGDGKRKKMDVTTFYTKPQMIALANAVERDDPARIRQLVREGADVNARGEGGMTYPVWAFGNRSKKALQTLLELGADPNARDDAGVSVMELAAEDKDLDFLKLLLAYKGDPNLRNRKNRPIAFSAMSVMNWPAVRLLAEKGVDINGSAPDGTTLMMQLAMFNQWDQVWDLLSKGADFKKQSTNGMTLAWQVQESRVADESPQAVHRTRVKAFLEGQGVKFPVPAPKVPNLDD